MLLPFLKVCRRYWLAARASVGPTQKAYSQNGEDGWLSSRISDKHIANGIYVDVGANHPTAISNTYLFYRRGGHGIIVEPNRAFRGLYRRFRQRDTVLTMGCGKTVSVTKFYANGIAVLSSFVEDKSLSDGTFEYIPIVPLASLQEATEGKQVYLLSIDVEGLNYDVLSTTGGLLDVTEWLVIEFGEEKAAIVRFMEEHGFAVAHETPHNLIFKNSKFLAA